MTHQITPTEEDNGWDKDPRIEKYAREIAAYEGNPDTDWTMYLSNAHGVIQIADEEIAAAVAQAHLQWMKGLQEKTVFEYAIAPRYLTKTIPGMDLRWAHAEDAREELRTRGIERDWYVIKRPIGSSIDAWKPVD